MSLINRMLQDLDARRADAEERAALPLEVRSLPPLRQSGGKLLALFRSVLLVAVGALGAWWYFQPASPPPAPPASASASAPVLLPTAPESVPAAAGTADKSAGVKPAPVPDRPSVAPAALRPKPRPAPGAEKAPPLPPPEKERAPAASESASRPAIAAPSPSAAPAAIEKTYTAASPRERAEINYRKAIALANGGRVAEATDLLLDTLRQDGSHSAARQLLVKLLIEQRKTDEAMALLHEGLEIQPAQIAWATTLARMQVDRGKLDAAWKTLEHSLAQGSASADYLGFCGHVLYRLGRQREAVAHYQSALKLAPGEGRWWVGLGLAQEADNHLPEAHDAFLRARASASLGADLAAFVDQKLR